jgi:pilus assembly protein CpaE
MSPELSLLVVDQDPDSRVATRKALQRAGFSQLAESGFGTAAISKALEVRPSLVLVDVEEPVGRPLETVEALSNALPDTPIVIYSSITDADSVRRGMVVGARDYLLKPLQPQSLHETIVRVLDQEERRKMRRTGQMDGVEGRGTVITVTGAKGGVGKSVLAVNLAVALRVQSVKPVVVLDADDEFGDVATMLDLQPTKTIADVISAGDGFNRETVPGFITTHFSGVDVIATSPVEDIFDKLAPAKLTEIIQTLARVYEFVVVDTSGSFNRFVRASMEAATLSLLVTSNEVSSVRDTASAVRRMESWTVDQDRVKVVLNHGARARTIGKSDIEAAIKREIFWEVPTDKRVPKSIQAGMPITLMSLGSKSSQSIFKLARRIGGAEQATAKPARRTLRSRLPWFKDGTAGAAVTALETNNE